jgi:hypothetical protein
LYLFSFIKIFYKNVAILINRKLVSRICKEFLPISERRCPSPLTPPERMWGKCAKEVNKTTHKSSSLED